MHQSGFSNTWTKTDNSLWADALTQSSLNKQAEWYNLYK